MNSLHQKIHERTIEYQTAKEAEEQEGKELKKSKDELAAYEEAQSIAQDVAKQIQEQAHAQIAKVVSICLEAVFDEPYYFQIHFERKRGRTEAYLTFEKEGKEVDPLDSAGGGVIDVAAFALRLACLLLSRPRLRPVMILDEPFKNLSKSKGYLDRVPDMLISLSEEFGVQFLMVTHIDELKIGTVIELE